MTTPGPEALDPSAASWELAGTVRDSHDVNDGGDLPMAGFAGGYAAMGYARDRGPSAFFAADGSTWVATPLANQVRNCAGWGPAGDELIADAEPAAITTDGHDVLIVGEVADYEGTPCGLPVPRTWLSDDGRHWVRSRPFPTTSDMRATAAWSVPGGWRAVSETTLWGSVDALVWERIADLPGDGSLIAGSPDGTLLAARSEPDSDTIVLAVSKDGRGWLDVDAPDECTAPIRIAAPARIGDDAWILVVETGLCISRDLHAWNAVPFKEAVLNVYQTRFGAIAIGDGCFGAGVTCAPDPRAWVETGDGRWAEISHPPIPWNRHLTDGPAGVLMVGTTRRQDAKEVWRLLP